MIYIFSYTQIFYCNKKKFGLKSVFIFTQQKADLGLDDLTVTSQRSQVVDFSTPFQTSSLKIMIKVSILTQYLILILISGCLVCIICFCVWFHSFWSLKFQALEGLKISSFWKVEIKRKSRWYKLMYSNRERPEQIMVKECCFDLFLEGSHI